MLHHKAAPEEIRTTFSSLEKASANPFLMFVLMPWPVCFFSGPCSHPTYEAYQFHFNLSAEKKTGLSANREDSRRMHNTVILKNSNWESENVPKATMMLLQLLFLFLFSFLTNLNMPFWKIRNQKGTLLFFKYYQITWQRAFS